MTGLPPLRPRSSWGRLDRPPRIFGRSAWGTPLCRWPAERDGATLLVLAGTHGDEGEGVACLSAALRMVPAGALAVPVVLALNPDGLSLGTRGNARGVDLNRNFPARNWRPGPLTYRWVVDLPRDVELGAGDCPASEPETRALLALVAELRPTTVLSVHAPLGCVDDPAKTALGAWLASETGLPRVPDVGYETPGSLGTWGAEQGISVVTLELPSAPRERLVADVAPILARVLLDPGLQTGGR